MLLKDGKEVGRLDPRMNFYPTSQAPVPTPAVRSRPWGDIYINLMAFKQDGRILRGVAWRAIERETFVTEHRSAIDLAFSLEQDTWNGERYLQLSVADFKEPDS